MNPASLIAAFTPPLCVACREPAPEAGPLCTTCLAELNSAAPVWGDPPPGLADCIAAFDHEGVARRLVHALKFARLEPLAPLMAGYMCEHLDPPCHGTVVVPVPAVRLRTALRGFDPAGLLAGEVAEFLGADLEDGAIRRRGIGRQRGGGRDERIGSPPDIRPVPVRPGPPRPVPGGPAHAYGRRRTGAGRPAGPLLLRGSPVLLVDDVITTGATVSACAKVLRGIGAGPVTALSFSRRV
jgi:predicted amidophosphoribosyltransferase